MKDAKVYPEYEGYFSTLLEVAETLILSPPPRFGDIAEFMSDPEIEENFRRLPFSSATDVLDDYFYSTSLF